MQEHLKGLLHAQATTRYGLNSHVCNCVGCCRVCGGCLTNPVHARVCADVAFHKAEITKIYEQASTPPTRFEDKNPPTPMADSYRRQAQAAARAIESSPAWMKNTAVPPKGELICLQCNRVGCPGSKGYDYNCDGTPRQRDSMG